MEDLAFAPGSVYADPSSVLDAIRSGDVLLVRATWLLRRAGYVPVTVEEEASRLGGVIPITHYEKRGDAVALPNRQQIEADHPEFQHYGGGVFKDMGCGTKLDHGVLLVGYGQEGNQTCDPTTPGSRVCSTTQTW